MARQVELSNGQMVEFPDEMSDDQIKSALQSRFKPQQTSLLEKAGNVAGKFNRFIEGTHLPDYAGGLLQGAGDIGASLGNVIARPLGHPIPHPKLGQYIGDSLASKGAFGLGQLSAQIPAFIGGEGLLNAGLGLGSKFGTSGSMLQSGLAGGLLGENNEGGGREASAIGAALLPAAISGTKTLSAMRGKNITKKVLATKAANIKQSGDTFKSIFKEVEDSGLGNLNLGQHKVNERLLSKAGDSDYLHALKVYNEKPTISHAHQAQSDLNSYISNIGKPQNKLERDAIKLAKAAKETLLGKISHALVQNKKTGLAHKYVMARQGFKEGVVPYLNSPSIKALESGKIRPKTFTSRIGGEEEFLAKVGHAHPELILREKLSKAMNNPLIKYGATTAAGAGFGGLGLYGLARLFR